MSSISFRQRPENTLAEAFSVDWPAAPTSSLLQLAGASTDEIRVGWNAALTLAEMRLVEFVEYVLDLPVRDVEIVHRGRDTSLIPGRPGPWTARELLDLGFAPCGRDADWHEDEFGGGHRAGSLGCVLDVADGTTIATYEPGSGFSAGRWMGRLTFDTPKGREPGLLGALTILLAVEARTGVLPDTFWEQVRALHEGVDDGSAFELQQAAEAVADYGFEMVVDMERFVDETFRDVDPRHVVGREFRWPVSDLARDAAGRLGIRELL